MRERKGIQPFPLPCMDFHWVAASFTTVCSKMHGAVRLEAACNTWCAPCSAYRGGCWSEWAQKSSGFEPYSEQAAGLNLVSSPSHYFFLAWADVQMFCDPRNFLSQYLSGVLAAWFGQGCLEILGVVYCHGKSSSAALLMGVCVSHPAWRGTSKTHRNWESMRPKLGCGQRLSCWCNWISIVCQPSFCMEATLK